MTTDAELRGDDTAARSAALDVQRSFIVQAPAGSGKTELLIQRYLRLLATVNEPEEILAITFTRKAAAEMQLRVLQALQAADRDEQPQETHRQLTHQAAIDVLARDRKLGWQLIANSGRMRIQTLDSLNAAISRMQPISSGSGTTNSSIVSDHELQALYDRAAYLTLDQLAEQGDLQAATSTVLRHLDNNTGLYCSYVARMLATRDQWLPFIASGRLGPQEAEQLRQRLEHNLETVVLARVRELHAALPPGIEQRLLDSARYAAGQLLLQGRDGHRVVDLQDARSLSANRPGDVTTWQGIADLLLTDAGDWRKRVTVTQGFPPKDGGEKQAFMELVGELGDNSRFRALLHAARDLPPTQYSDDQWRVLLAVFRLLPLAVIELQRLFAERGVTDYIEIALSAAAALGSSEDPGDIAMLLDYQLRHILVDEMQDTASAQYRILEALTAGWQDGDGRTMFCVGDPMQSIYRFRNAEVGQFLLAQAHGIGSVRLEPITLRQNFRSGENLVHWFNTVFPGVLASADDPMYSAVSYEPSASVPALEGIGTCVTHPLFGNDVEREAECGFAVIRRTLEEHPDDSMAVLVRSRTRLRELLQKLRLGGIQYNAIEIDRLTDLPEIIDALALARALAHPGDRLAWLALLRSPFAGLDWSDLHALVAGASRHATVRELLCDDERLGRLSRHGRGAAENLRDVLAREMRANRIETLRDRVERLWLQLGGPAILSAEQAVDNVYRFLDVLERLEQGGTLADVARLEAALDQEHVSSEGNARLHVMTMHKAKGLEFDHVLLYGLGHTPAQQTRSVLSWFDIPGEQDFEEKVLSPVGPRAEVDNDPVHRFIERTENIKYEHELGRLLYVACTRARRSLHLVGHVEVAGDPVEIRSPRNNTLLQLLWPQVRNDFERAFASAGEIAAPTKEAVWRMPKLQRFTQGWKLPDFDGVPGTVPSRTPPAEDSEVEFYWVGSSARIAGTLVHRWLHLLATGRQRSFKQTGPEIREVTQHWLRGMGIRHAAADEISARVGDALANMLADARGRWLLDGPGAAELGLSGVLDGELTSVVLDRVRIDDDGTHWIVDYKTSSHEGGNLDAFIDAEVARYMPQLQKYRQLYAAYAGVDAQCALYFPLLQKFVELPL